MSYEGYSQLLCDRGHQWHEDCYQTDYPQTCPVCGGIAVWENMVDLTNGSFDETTGVRIDGYVELETSKIDACDKCGHITEMTYKIPGRGAE